jgi:hypothetical protein
VVGEPWLNRLRLMNLVVIHDDIEPRVLLGRIVRLDDLEQVSE